MMGTSKFSIYQESILSEQQQAQRRTDFLEYLSSQVAVRVTTFSNASQSTQMEIVCFGHLYLHDGV